MSYTVADLDPESQKLVKLFEGDDDIMIYAHPPQQHKDPVLQERLGTRWQVDFCDPGGPREALILQRPGWQRLQLEPNKLVQMSIF